MHAWETTNYYDRKNDYIEVTSPIFEPGGEDVIGVVLASVSTDNIEVTRHVLLTQGGIITGIVMILLAVFSVFFADRMVRPDQEDHGGDRKCNGRIRGRCPACGYLYRNAAAERGV